MSIPLTYFWPFNAYDKRVQQTVLEEFADAGADGVNFNPSDMAAMMADPGEIRRWKKMLSATGVSFRDAHAPFGPLQDLSCPLPELVPHMVLMHKHCLRLCAEFGVKSCTIHVGRPTDYCRDVAVAHDNMLRALEQLLPTAGECGVVICIENIWDPTSTAGMLLDAINRLQSPWLGVCWDSGHAQLSRSDVPDTPEQTCRRSWESCGIHDREASDDYLPRLLPHVVTCHLHTNNRIWDCHWLPTDPRGMTDWAPEMALLKKAPRLLQLQNEAITSPENPFTIRQHVASLKTIAALG